MKIIRKVSQREIINGETRFHQKYPNYSQLISRDIVKTGNGDRQLRIIRHIKPGLAETEYNGKRFFTVFDPVICMIDSSYKTLETAIMVWEYHQLDIHKVNLSDFSGL